MKKSIVVLFVAVSVLALSGCMTMMTGYEPIDHNGSQIRYKHYDDLDNPFDHYEITLQFVSGGLFTNLLGSNLELGKFVSPKGGTYYALQLKLDLQDWLFVERFKVATDAQTFTFEDKTPRRDVLSGDHVVEQLSVVLSEDQVNSLRESSSIRYQWGSEIYTLTPEEIKVKNDFFDYVSGITTMQGQM